MCGRKNNVDLSADSSPFYSKPNATSTDNGNYQVVVTNSCGSSTSDPVSVFVLPPPVLNVQQDFDDFLATAGQFSFPQSYTITGTDLRGPVDIEIDAPFEISTLSTGGWQSQLSYESSRRYDYNQNIVCSIRSEEDYLQWIHPALYTTGCDD